MRSWPSGTWGRTVRRSYYRSGPQLSVQGRGQPEGMQKITALRRTIRLACPKSGCKRYEEGWQIVLNLADPKDANVARYIREGKLSLRYEEVLLPEIQGAVAFRFLPGQPCPGHTGDGWQEPIYIVGERKTVHDEWHERYCTGAEALVAARTRLKERQEG